MTDISIGKFLKGNGGKAVSNNSEFANLENEYIAFKKKMAESDFANSPAAKDSEVKILQKMLEAAKKEGLTDKAKEISDKINSLLSKEIDGNSLSGVYYSPISNKSIPAFSGESHILEDCKNENGELDVESMKIMKAFGKDEIHSMPYLLRRCRGNSGKISSSVLNFVMNLTKAGVYPNTAMAFLDYFSYIDDDGECQIDESLSDTYSELKLNGVEECYIPSIVKLIKNNFEDENVIKNSAIKMYKYQIAPNQIINLIQNLAVKSQNSEKMKVSETAADTLVALKNMLLTTRKKDRTDYDNPINQLYISRTKLADGSIMIMNKHKITYMTPIEAESVNDLENTYEKALAELEDKLLIDISKKYKDENGEIKVEPIRIITQLRNLSVPTDELLDLTDFCLDDECKIKKENVEIIRDLRKAGALAKDLIPIIDAVGKDEDGNYNDENLKNACALTSAIIPAENVIDILPQVKGNPDIKDLVINLTDIFKSKDSLCNLPPLVKTQEGNTDGNAVSIIYNLAENRPKTIKKDEQFIEGARKLINESLNPETHCVDDEAAGICYVMLKNNEKLINVIEGLRLCKNSDGSFNKELSEILWDKSIQKAAFSEIKAAIKEYKKNN